MATVRFTTRWHLGSSSGPLDPSPLNRLSTRRPRRRPANGRDGASHEAEGIAGRREDIAGEPDAIAGEPGASRGEPEISAGSRHSLARKLDCLLWDRDLPAWDRMPVARDRDLPAWDRMPIARDRDLPAWDRMPVARDRDLPAWGRKPVTRDRDLPAWGRMPVARDRDLPAWKCTSKLGARAGREGDRDSSTWKRDSRMRGRDFSRETPDVTPTREPWRTGPTTRRGATHIPFASRHVRRRPSLRGGRSLRGSCRCRRTHPTRSRRARPRPSEPA
jgi:hypothetical protein